MPARHEKGLIDSGVHGGDTAWQAADHSVCSPTDPEFLVGRCAVLHPHLDFELDRRLEPALWIRGASRRIHVLHFGMACSASVRYVPEPQALSALSNYVQTRGWPGADKLHCPASCESFTIC